MDEENLTIKEENEERIVFTDGFEDYVLNKKETETIQQILKNIPLDYVVPVQYNSDLGEGNVKTFVSWIKTNHVTIQLHYFLEKGKIEIDAHVLEFIYEENLYYLPVDVQGEIKTVFNEYLGYVERNHRKKVAYEDHVQEFLEATPFQNRHPKANGTSIRRYGVQLTLPDFVEMIQEYVEEEKEEGLTYYQIFSMIQEDYHELLQYPLFSYVLRTKLIEIIKNEPIKPVKDSFLEKLVREQRKYKLVLSDEQKEEIENVM